VLNFSDHQKLGEEIKTAYKIILEANILLSNNYPKKSEPNITAENAIHSIMQLKSVMDEAVSIENPDKGDSETIPIYFC
jgi:hypothetical protein